MASIEKRQLEDGSTSYRVKVRLKGFSVQHATFHRLTDAKKWAQQIESDLRRGRYFDDSQAKKYTMAEIIDRYVAQILRVKNSNTTNQKHYLKWWKETIGSYLLSDVSPSLISEFRNKLLSEVNQFGQTRSAATANRYCTALGHVFSIAVKEWELIQANPFARIKKFKEPRGRVRFLADDERSKLLTACKQSTNPHLYTVVVLALSTGGRKMELLNLKWSDVDFKREVITLHETKNGERRILPIKGIALTLLSKMHDQASGTKFVFQSKEKIQPIDIRTAWENALKKAEIQDFRFHDLRHSAASYLAMNGASLAEIAEVLGHKSLQMVKRYAHLSEAHTASVVEQMNNKIFGEVV